MAESLPIATGRKGLFHVCMTRLLWRHSFSRPLNPTVGIIWPLTTKFGCHMWCRVVMVTQCETDICENINDNNIFNIWLRNGSIRTLYRFEKKMCMTYLQIMYNMKSILLNALQKKLSRHKNSWMVLSLPASHLARALWSVQIDSIACVDCCC